MAVLGKRSPHVTRALQRGLSRGPPGPGRCSGRTRARALASIDSARLGEGKGMWEGEGGGMRGR